MIVWQRLGSTWKGNVEEVHRCVFAQTRELCHHQRSGGAAPAPSLLALIDQCFDQPWLHDLSSLLVLIHLLSTVTPLVSSHAVDLGPRHVQLLSLPSGGWGRGGGSSKTFSVKKFTTLQSFVSLSSGHEEFSVSSAKAWGHQCIAINIMRITVVNLACNMVKGTPAFSTHSACVLVYLAVSEIAP